MSNIFFQERQKQKLQNDQMSYVASYRRYIDYKNEKKKRII